MKKGSRIQISTTQIIMLSFLLTIFVGSILLSLPISSASGEPIAYIDALFTATTATCVTGLVTLPTFSAFSTFGHVVILLLIQIGGLGVITVMSAIMIMLHRRIGLGDSVLIQDAFNINTLSGLVGFIKKVIAGTFIVEAVGALFYMIVFVPEFGLRGIWISVFTSVSAFCNAGIDIISENSLCAYATNPVINAVTSLLIILGGLGYIVWWDIIRVVKKIRRQGIKAFAHLTLHTKVVLSSTFVLIFAGALLIFAFERENPLTVGTYSLAEKLQASLFQSVTTRTAGFAAIDQQHLTNGTSIVSMLLMFIGGSPAGTAGGIKTVTFTVLVASAISSIKNREETTLFNRSIRRQAVSRALAVATMSSAIMLASTLLLSAVTDASALDIFYETVSATATVGLTRGLTSQLNTWGKLIITATMYLGRIGPISLAVAFNVRKKSHNIVKSPYEDISIG